MKLIKKEIRERNVERIAIEFMTTQTKWYRNDNLKKNARNSNQRWSIHFFIFLRPLTRIVKRQPSGRSYLSRSRRLEFSFSSKSRWRAINHSSARFRWSRTKNKETAGISMGRSWISRGPFSETNRGGPLASFTSLREESPLYGTR